MVKLLQYLQEANLMYKQTDTWRGLEKYMSANIVRSSSSWWVRELCKK